MRVKNGLALLVTVAVAVAQVQDFILDGLAVKGRDKRTYILPTSDKVTRTKVCVACCHPSSHTRGAVVIKESAVRLSSELQHCALNEASLRPETEQTEGRTVPRI